VGHVGPRLAISCLSYVKNPLARFFVNRTANFCRSAAKVCRQEFFMDKALYIAMTGAKHNMLAQSVHANNLANVNTTGFRADFAQARSMAVYHGDGHQSRAYALTESPSTDFSEGSMMSTGRELDFSIRGKGMIAVQAPDGSEAYTRAGNLALGPNGELLTANGLPVLGDGGPIVLPPAEKIDIGSDGSITVLGAGEGAATLVLVDRIKLVGDDVKNMTKGNDGLTRSRDGEPLEVDGDVRIVSGFLESSNVNAINEFTEVLSLARQYEMHIKMMKTVETNSEASARLLQTQ